jgi:hypothetical protein
VVASQLTQLNAKSSIHVPQNSMLRKRNTAICPEMKDQLQLDIVKNKELKMATETYNRLSEKEKREVGMYGVTEAGMREAVENSITFKLSGPEMMVASLLSDAQEMMAYEQPDFNVIEDQRQLLNRAKWILFTYVTKSRE